MNRYKSYIGLLVTVAMLLFSYRLPVQAADEGQGISIPSGLTTNGEHKIMVSLGDSYSSGEGIEPFYGQDTELRYKVQDIDWLAHRSRSSWPGLLTIPGDNTAMSAYKDQYWFFRATSGATTEHMRMPFIKSYSKEVPLGAFSDGQVFEGGQPIDPQLNIFYELEQNSVSYVTITIGGNDVDFSGIVQQAALQGIPFVNRNGLTEKLNAVWSDFYAPNGVENDIRDVYERIESLAGPQAHIIVAGYPQLISVEADRTGTGRLFSDEEAQQINSHVMSFNLSLKELVQSCQDDGMDISFVDVEDAFKGHEAYSSDPWINPVYLFAKDEDLDDSQLFSSYSIHPNEKGAQAYAACVQARIDEIETGELYDPDLSDSVLDHPDAYQNVEFGNTWRDRLRNKALEWELNASDRLAYTINEMLDLVLYKISGQLDAMVESFLSELLIENCY